ncbi:TRAP transporter permease [Caldalkalibacillus salinus]|uniref:TRAP transporter permease n=1 Tax=Caldalkalibacillus salinus TaxID=2803787 RepID=UPI001923D2A7|nr:TRAP transporter permease [Caldalkalibacillus salinus]
MSQEHVDQDLRKYDPEQQTRLLSGIQYKLFFVLAISLSLYHLYTAHFGMPPWHIHRTVHLCLGLSILFLLFPFSKKSINDKVPFYDLILSMIPLAFGAYFIYNIDDIMRTMGRYDTFDVILNAVMILLVLEGARRAVGWPIVVLGFGALLLTMTVGGLDYSLIIPRHVYTDTIILGTPIAVSAQFIFLFLFFGVLLRYTGTGKFFNDLAFALAGRYTGGPGKAAVIASAFQGTITGSSIANTVGSGSFTIPLMKKLGFRPRFAGAVEASASTGGQILPPVMGAAAFIMIEFTGMTYIEIAMAAAIPAVLYFVGVFMSVHFEAKREGLSGMSVKNLPHFWPLLLKKGYMLLPLVVIVITLGNNMSPMKAAWYGIFAAFVLSFLSRETRLSIKQMIEVLVEATRVAIPVIAAVAAAGMVAGNINAAGFGLQIASTILDLSGGYVIPTLILSMLACIVLGMGLPTTANYVVTATLIAPAILQLEGVPVLAAHLFVFYFGIMADITPPVGLAAYAGAGVAGASPIRTGVSATRIAFAAFLIPYIFVLNPMLVLQGDVEPLQLGFAIASAVIGMVMISSAFAGHLISKMNVWERIPFFIAGIFMVNPGYLSDIVGIAVLITVGLIQYFNKRKDTPASEVS